VNTQAASPDNEVTANETFQNWQSFVRNEPCRTVMEARLYTDTSIIGELTGLGPYSFINTIAHAGHIDPRAPRPAIVLRIAFHIPGGVPAVPMTDDFEHYHGGDFVDEMAAIASLFLGIRLRAGPVDREFIPGADPYSRPIGYGSKAVPELPLPAGRVQIPRLSGEQNLVDLEVLRNFPMRTARETNTLIKAARIYQQAIWIADSDPALAWLLLISAVETAAVHWAGEEGSLRERLEASLPQLFKLLENSKCSDLIDDAATILQKYTRATKKFIDFLHTFSPGAPDQRPTQFLFSFKPKDIKEAASIIYSHRSESLHNGTAFPLPMCSPPQLFSFDGKQDSAHSEVPAGLATYSLGASGSASRRRCCSTPLSILRAGRCSIGGNHSRRRWMPHECHMTCFLGKN
jgi:hypothetical protein